jgi:hypothetical protein
MRMPFGRYRGQLLSQVPDSYLAWLRSIALREPLASAVAEEQLRREQIPLTLTLPVRSVPLFAELLERGYRALARHKHPDTGGSTEAMQELNALVASMRQQLEDAGHRCTAA